MKEFGQENVPTIPGRIVVRCLIALALLGEGAIAHRDEAVAQDLTTPLSPKFPDGNQRAFPTAEGFGAGAVGGRGGKAIYVVNTTHLAGAFDLPQGQLRRAIPDRRRPGRKSGRRRRSKTVHRGDTLRRPGDQHIPTAACLRRGAGECGRDKA